MTAGRLTAMDILRHLDRSNCRECDVPTCMAFAALVIQGQKALADCPRLAPEIVEKLSGTVTAVVRTGEDLRSEMTEQIRAQVAGIDYPGAAERISASMNGDRLSIRCLGKPFELDPDGALHSECHVNSWVHLPLLNYVTTCQGRAPSGEWVTFDELSNARDWVRFFSHRCENAMKKIADRDPDLFIDSLDLFSGAHVEKRPADRFSTADDAIVLKPLPLVPLMIAYWRPEDGFESTLTLFFDRTAEVNLGAEAIYMLTTGLVEMFKKIMVKHGRKPG
ncbi:MAG: DUF3786 domain-containing protein [Deltaproteobacteria bacterium]|nr:DUF3786 domain-containing protein [Deltaproteobacteria bacterium]